MTSAEEQHLFASLAEVSRDIKSHLTLIGELAEGRGGYTSWSLSGADRAKPGTACQQADPFEHLMPIGEIKVGRHEEEHVMPSMGLLRSTDAPATDAVIDVTVAIDKVQELDGAESSLSIRPRQP